MPYTAPHIPALLGHGETREHRSWAILDGRHLSAALPFVAHCNCIGFLYSARPGYRPHFPLSTKRALSVRFPRNCIRHVAGLLDHLVRLEEERRGDRDPERLGGLQIDDQL